MFTIQSRFYTTFKTGDNAAYNAKILRLLYKCQKRAAPKNRPYFAKPIIIQIASIVETVMYDLRSRFVICHQEVKTQFDQSIIANIKKLDKEPKFNQLVAALTQTKIIDSEDKFVVKAISMKNLRDRVHIQNTRSKGERDEEEAFTLEKQIEAEQVLEKTLKAFEKNCSRDQSTWHVQNINLPWKPHYLKNEITKEEKQKRTMALTAIKLRRANHDE